MNAENIRQKMKDAFWYQGANIEKNLLEAASKIHSSESKFIEMEDPMKELLLAEQNAKDAAIKIRNLIKQLCLCQAIVIPENVSDWYRNMKS